MQLINRIKLPLWRRCFTSCSFLATVAVAFTTVGCHEKPDGTEVVSASQKCVVEPPATVSRGGAFSLGFSSGAYFIFGETWQGGENDFKIINSSGATLSSGGDPCTELSDVRQSDGKLANLIPLTPEEEAENIAPADGRRTAIWPISGFVVGDVGTIYYRKVRLKDYFDVIDVGVGVARIQYGGIAERTSPTLVWENPQNAWGQSAFVANDGYAYVYGCYQRASFDLLCRVARVAADRAAEPGEYRYFDGTDWVAEPERAASVLDGAPPPSVAENAHLGRLFAVHPGYLENRVLGRTAKRPEGPFASADELFVGKAPKAYWVNDVVQHPALARDGDQKIMTSYYTDPEDGPAGIRFVELTLE
jgi:hypothetical protein